MAPLNLTVPWGLLTTNATTNRLSARHGAISGPKMIPVLRFRVSKSDRAVGIADNKCNNKSAICTAKCDFRVQRRFQCLFLVPLNLTVPWGLLTTSAAANRPSAWHGAISMFENDPTSFFHFLNLTVPYGVVTANATTNQPPARHGVI